MKYIFVNPFSLILLCCMLSLSCEQPMEKEGMTFDFSAEIDNEFSAIIDNMHSDPTWALEQCDELIERGENLNALYYSGKAKWLKGFIHDEIKQDVSQAYFYYNEALKDLEQTDSSSIKMSVLTNLGLLYRFYGQYDAAINSYETALALKKDLSPKQLSDLYYNYGVSLKLKGDESSFSKAEAMFTRSLEFAKKTKDDQNIASVNNQIGLMYKAIGDYDMARMAYKNNIQNYGQSPEMSEFVGKAWHGMGVTYLDQGKYKEAKDAFNTALKFKQKSGSVFVTLYDLGTVHNRTGDTDQAILIWKNALKEQHDLNDIEQLQIYVELTRALSKEGNFKEAVGFNQTFNDHIGILVEEGAKYKLKNNQVLFADVVREYEEFNQPKPPVYARFWPMLTLSVALFLSLYLIFFFYHRNRLSKEMSEQMSRIQSEFKHIRID